MRIQIPKRVTEITPPGIDIVNARAAAWRERGVDVVSLGQALPGFPPPPCALQAARESLADADTHIYSADAGIRPLRHALCAALAAYSGLQADPDTEVIITAGGNQAFILALMTFLEPGDEVLLPSPYFMNHEMSVRAVGGMPVEAPLWEETGFALRLEDVEPYLTPRTRALVIVTPNNPTGAVYGQADLTCLSQALASRGVSLIVDETYLQFVYEGARYFSVASLAEVRDSVITVGSFSKSFAMTGWRVGYLIAPRDFVTEAMKIQDAMVICAPVVAQQAVLAALTQTRDYPQQFMAAFNQRRRYLQDRLAQIPMLHWQPTYGGFFAFVKVSNCQDAQQLAIDILDQVHVVTIPGNLFGRAGEGFLRLSYGSVEMPALKVACDRLAQFF